MRRQLEVHIGPSPKGSGNYTLSTYARLMAKALEMGFTHDDDDTGIWLTAPSVGIGKIEDIQLSGRPDVLVGKLRGAIDDMQLMQWGQVDDLKAQGVTIEYTAAKAGRPGTLQLAHSKLGKEPISIPTHGKKEEYWLGYEGMETLATAAAWMRGPTSKIDKPALEGRVKKRGSRGQE